jgi:hypothetical protein
VQRCKTRAANGASKSQIADDAAAVIINCPAWVGARVQSLGLVTASAQSYAVTFNTQAPPYAASNLACGRQQSFDLTYKHAGHRPHQFYRPHKHSSARTCSCRERSASLLLRRAATSAALPASPSSACSSSACCFRPSITSRRPAGTPVKGATKAAVKGSQKRSKDYGSWVSLDASCSSIACCFSPLRASRRPVGTVKAAVQVFLRSMAVGGMPAAAHLPAASGPR